MIYLNLKSQGEILIGLHLCPLCGLCHNDLSYMDEKIIQIDKDGAAILYCESCYEQLGDC